MDGDGWAPRWLVDESCYIRHSLHRLMGVVSSYLVGCGSLSLVVLGLDSFFFFPNHPLLPFPFLESLLFDSLLDYLVIEPVGWNIVIRPRVLCQL